VERYLKPTTMIDCDAEVIKEKAREVVKPHEGTVENAARLFYFVRDGIKYNPFLPRYLPDHFRASSTLARREGFCIQKAVLLVSLARTVGIPARLGFAIIKNHLLPAKIVEMLEVQVLPDHGYAELYIGDKWVKATPSFDLETCRKNRIIPVEFDGERDAKLNAYNQDGQLHIEYLLDRGSYEDVPIGAIREWLVAVMKPEATSLLLGP
jgi:transglutaminase-like putative cysteine protease